MLPIRVCLLTPIPAGAFCRRITGTQFLTPAQLLLAYPLMHDFHLAHGEMQTAKGEFMSKWGLWRTP